MANDVRKKYKILAELMNQKSLMKVSVVPGLIDCFECMMSEEEADFLIKLGTARVKFEDLRRFSALSDEAYTPFIYNIQRKGMVWLEYAEEQKYAELAPIFPGWIEIILSDGFIDEKKQEFAEKFGKLLRLKQQINILPLRAFFNHKYNKKKAEEVAPITMASVAGNVAKKTISVNKKIDFSDNTVYPTKVVTDILHSLPDDYPIALITCFCRTLQRVLGKPCTFELPEKACITMGNFARQMVEFGIGEFIDKERAFNIITECEKKGAIHNIFHSGMNTEKPEISICNCCWDCCALYGTFNRGGLSPMYVMSYYIPRFVQRDACISCGRCEHFCPTGATLLRNGQPVLEEKNCIGCGQCAYQCPKNVREMEFCERKVFVEALPKDKVRIK